MIDTVQRGNIYCNYKKSNTQQCVLLKSLTSIIARMSALSAKFALHVLYKLVLHIAIKFGTKSRPQKCDFRLDFGMPSVLRSAILR